MVDTSYGEIGLTDMIDKAEDKVLRIGVQALQLMSIGVHGLFDERAVTATGYTYDNFGQDLKKYNTFLKENLLAIYTQHPANLPSYIETFIDSHFIRRTLKGKELIGETRQALRGLRSNNNWLADNIDTAYVRGLNTSRRRAVKDVGISRPKIRKQAGKKLLFRSTVHAQATKVLHSRNLRLLEGFTEDMASRVIEAITRGALEGRSIQDTADNLLTGVDLPLRTDQQRALMRFKDRFFKRTKRAVSPSELTRFTSLKQNERALLIVRTEIVRAKHKGAITEAFDLAKQYDVEVLFRWVATRGVRTRPTHRARDGKLYTYEAVLLLIGEPNCRCSIIPKFQNDK